MSAAEEAYATGMLHVAVIMAGGQIVGGKLPAELHFRVPGLPGMTFEVRPRLVDGQAAPVG